MEKSLEFRYAIPKPISGPVIEVSAAEVEQKLLKQLEDPKHESTDTLWELARLYQQTNQPEKGLDCLRQVLAHLADVEKKAGCVLALGQMMESARDYPAAVRYYKEALSLEPMQTSVWYFIHNNLGYCLNTLSEFGQGELYCRKAIEIDALRPNGFKNLGIALTGQGQYQEAARCFVAATQADAGDGRAFGLLKALIKEHPELEFEFQGYVDLCQKAVEFAAQKAQAMKPLVYTGWRRRLFLLRLNLLSIVRQLRNSSSKRNTT
ncbi:MAG: hypothetical protein C5B50_11390 [Verrucomicrobia bacterium]|nr:MAG: hypothetical protein C5B50_11390 [Verrucomicrobiota bacterium]